MDPPGNRAAPSSPATDDCCPNLISLSRAHSREHPLPFPARRRHRRISLPQLPTATPPRPTPIVPPMSPPSLRREGRRFLLTSNPSIVARSTIFSEISDPNEQELQLGVSSSSTGQKLEGASNSLASARASSVFAAYNRFINSSYIDCSLTNTSQKFAATAEPGPDDGELKAVDEKVTAEPDPDDTVMAESYTMPSFKSSIEGEEPDPDDCIDKDSRKMFEPDPDDFMVSVNECDQHNLQAVEDAKIAGLGSNEICGDMLEPDPDDSESAGQ